MPVDGLPGTSARPLNSTPKPTASTTRVVGWLIILVLTMEAGSLAITAPQLVYPQILAAFHTSQAAWLTVAATLAGAVTAPLLGRVADVYGKKRVMAAILAAAAAGSVICWLAPNFGIFLIGRALVGTIGALVALSITLVRQIFPPRAVAIGVGICATGTGALQAFAPFLVKWAVATTGFRAVFWLPAIWFVVACVMFIAVIPESPVRASGRINLIEGCLLGSGLAVMLGAISMAPAWGWTTARTLGLFALGATLTALWAAISLRSTEPLVSLRVFRDRRLLLGFGMAALMGVPAGLFFLILTFAATTPASLGLGYGFGAGTGQMAAYYAIFSGAGLLGGLLGGHAAGRRLGLTRTSMVGFAFLLLASGLPLASLSSHWGLLAIPIFTGLGLGFAQAAIYNLVVSLVHPEIQGVVSTLTMLVFLSTASSATVVVVAVLNSQYAMPIGAAAPVYSKQGLDVALSILVVCCLLALVLAAMLQRSVRPARVAEEPAAAGSKSV